MTKLKKTKDTKEGEPKEEGALHERLLDAVQENPRRAAVAAAVVVGAVLLALLALSLTQRAARNRVAAVSGAVESYLAAGPAGNVTAMREQFENLSKKYSRTVEGAEAQYYLAGLFAAEGNYTAAAETYLNLREKHGSKENFSSAATLGLAYVYRMMGEGEKALATFEELMETGEVPVPRSSIRLEMARVLEALDRAGDAASIYRSLADESPDTPWGTQARERLDSLEGA